MAKVQFAADPTDLPIDQTLLQQAAIAERVKRPIKARVQPDLYDATKGSYVSWAGLIWSVELEGVEEGQRLREGLTSFFRLFGRDQGTQELLLRTLGELQG